MASPTYQQQVDRNDDRSAMVDKFHRARGRVADLETACAGGEAQIRAAQSRLDAIPAYERGWMVEIIALLALVSITLEWYPAKMMTLVFFFATAVELVALTAAFAFGGFLLGLLLGELLRRQRRPQDHGALDWVILSASVVAVGAFLTVGYLLRLGFAQASNDAAQSPIGPAVQAAALTTLAFIGIVIAFTAGYYRESVEAMRVRWRLGHLHRRVKTAQQHLLTVRAELEAAERAHQSILSSEAAAAGQQRASSNPVTNGASAPAAVTTPPGASSNGVSSVRGEF